MEEDILRLLPKVSTVAAGMEENVLQHLPNGGAVAAVIAVVWIFLKRQERSEDAIKAVVDAFAAETSKARLEYREHVTAIMQLGLDAHRETRTAIRSLDKALRDRSGSPPDLEPPLSPEAPR